MRNQLLRSFPSIDRRRESRLVSQLSAALGRERVRDLLREITDELRKDLSGVWSLESGARNQKSEVGSRKSSDDSDPPLHAPDSRLLTPVSLLLEVERRLEARAAANARPSLRRVIN